MSLQCLEHTPSVYFNFDDASNVSLYLRRKIPIPTSFSSISPAPIKNNLYTDCRISIPVYLIWHRVYKKHLWRGWRLRSFLSSLIAILLWLFKKATRKHLKLWRVLRTLPFKNKTRILISIPPNRYHQYFSNPIFRLRNSWAKILANSIWSSRLYKQPPPTYEMSSREAKKEEVLFLLLKLKKGQFSRASKTFPTTLKCLKSLRKNWLMKIPSKSSCPIQKQTNYTRNQTKSNLLGVWPQK